MPLNTQVQTATQFQTSGISVRHQYKFLLVEEMRLDSASRASCRFYAYFISRR